MSPKFYVSLAATIITIVSAKEFVFETETFRPCKGPQESKLHLNFKNYNRTMKVVSGWATFNRPFDETVGTAIDFERWTSSGWVKVPFVPLMPNACETYLRAFKAGVMEFAKHINMSHMDQCPWPAGHYVIKDFVVGTYTKFNLPFTGRFRSQLKFVDMKTKANVACLEINGNMKEKADS